MKILKFLIWLLLLVFVLFLGLGYYLEVRDELTKADAIVVISGGGEERLALGIQLFQDQWADKLILSGAARDDGPSNAASMRVAAVRAGIPKQVIMLEEKSQNTYQNALYVEEILQEQNFDSIILVTSAYHQRRAYITFREVLPAQIQIINAPAPVTFWRAGNWFKNEKSRKLALQEIGKIIYSALSGDYGQKK